MRGVYELSRENSEPSSDEATDGPAADELPTGDESDCIVEESGEQSEC